MAAETQTPLCRIEEARPGIQALGHVEAAEPRQGHGQADLRGEASLDRFEKGEALARVGGVTRRRENDQRHESHAANPMNDGKMIRVPVPPLTEERRKDMVKHLHKILEEHRTAVRNIRRDGNDAIKKAMKDKKITEDDEKRALEEIQKLTDDEIKKMEDMSKAKEKEVMQI